MVDPTIIRRLAFIKYLYGVGIEQSKAPEPLAGASLLTFHDAVELFLQLASEHLNAGTAHPAFMDYWPLLSGKLALGTELPQKESMRRLNKARVALKHHGILPAKLDIEAFRASTTAFFEDSASIVFALPFAEISLTDFVQPQTAQAKLKSAEQLLRQDQLEKALGEIAIAFEEMLADYEGRKHNQFSDSPFFFGRDLTFHNSFFMGLKQESGMQRIAEFIDGVQESIEAMQKAIKMLALGLDYRRYARFQLHVPFITQTEGGTYHLDWNYSHGGPGPTKDDVQYCIDFVVEVAIRLREFDYDVPPTRVGT